MSLKMEQSLSSITFKGSIAEAITEAKLQKKLFVVYTAGDKPESKLLETSTWIDPIVSEAVAKYCVLLHLLEGSSGASNFSAIYPQNSTPCITVIGYNGLRLWQQEGFVAADVLASNLEKAWLSLHVKETTAALLTAALASGKQPVSETSESPSSDRVNPGANGSLMPMNDHSLSEECGQQSNSETKAERSNQEDGSKDIKSKLNDETSLSPSTNVLDSSVVDESNSVIGTGNVLEIGQTNAIIEKNVDISNHLSSANVEETTEVEKNDVSDFPAVRSTHFFLNIRLLDGSNLQAKFSVSDTLRMVKEYINDSQKRSLGSFSLAIPYPRKVFDDQDSDRTLSELGLSNRQSLVVVSHNKIISHDRGGFQINPSIGVGSSSERNEGYWESVKRLISYVNPFSYLGGGTASSSAAHESQSRGTWQYSPNSSLQNDGQSTPASGSNINNNRGRKPSGFGGNIHTLKHDEDDGRFNDRNAFWNGNSTQYGGDNDGGKQE